jgi:hypothetical protein
MIKYETSIGENMKQYARILATLTFLIGCGVAANAEMQNDVIVNLPFDFVVNGTTLQAGTYTVSHSTGDGSGLLKLTNRDKGTGVFVLPKVSESASFDNPHVRFQRVGEERFLSEIRTASVTYYIPVSHSRAMEAAAKSHEGVSAAAGGSGNE